MLWILTEKAEGGQGQYKDLIAIAVSGVTQTRLTAEEITMYSESRGKKHFNVFISSTAVPQVMSFHYTIGKGLGVIPGQDCCL